MLSVTFSAIDRAPFLGLKGYGGFHAAVSAGYGKHLTLLTVTTPALSPSRRAALRASPRFILQAMGLIEFLLVSAKYELLPTITAHQSFVC